MLKRITAVFLAALMLAFCAGCAREEGGIEVDPNPGAGDTVEEYLVLYYGDPTGTYLVPEYRLVDVPANQTAEEYIVKEAIKGPAEEMGGKLSLINPSCGVSSVKTGDDIITVTLDKNFLDWSFLGDRSEAELSRLKYLAVTSVANSLIEATGYSKVQILVDRDNSGIGSRVLAEELGFLSEEGAVLGLLSWNGDVVLDPQNTMKVLLEGMQDKDYDMIYSLIASDDSKPSNSYFSTMLENKPVVESFEIRGLSLNPESRHCRVIISYTMRDSSGAYMVKSSVPIELFRENDVWKIDYDEFLSLFEEGTEG